MAITFWLNFEANDITGTYDMVLDGANAEYSAGDTTGTYASGATISNTGAFEGSNYCLSIPTVADNMSFSGDSIISLTKGRIGLWLRFTGAPCAYAQWFKYLVDAGNQFMVVSSADPTSELLARWRIGASNEANTFSTTASIGSATWYFLEIAYDTTLGVTDYLDIYINGNRVINSVQALSTMPSGGTFYLGDIDSGTCARLTDNVMISDDPTHDFWGGGTGECIAVKYPAAGGSILPLVAFGTLGGNCNPMMG